MANPEFKNPFQKPETPKNPFALEEKPQKETSLQNENIDTLITQFENSDDFLLWVYSDQLRNIKDTLSSENINSVQGTINSMLKTRDKQLLKGYMEDLQEEVASYERKKGEITGQAEEDRKNQTEENNNSWLDFSGPMAWIESSIWSSEDVEKIEEISIDGQVETPEEFVSKIARLQETIKTTQYFQKLDTEEQNSLLTFLEDLWNTFVSENNKSVNFVNTTFDDLARQIDKQAEWEISIDLWGNMGNINFSSKKEAFEFITRLKSEAESEIQWFLRNTAETVGSLLLTWMFYGSDIFTKPYQIYGDIISESYNDWNEKASGLEQSGNLLLLTIWGFATVNYTETLYRRIVVDTLWKFGIERFNYTSFDRQQLTFLPEGMSATDQEELNNRMDAFRYLEEKWASLVGKEKIEFEKELINIREHIGIRSNTFWLKVRALRLGRGIFIRPLYALKYGPKLTPFNIIRHERNYVTTNNEAEKTRLKSALSYVFSNPRFQETSNGKIERVDHDGESDNIKFIKNYILSRSDISESEKRSRIKRLDDFMNSLETYPRWEVFIKAELVSIAKEWKLWADEVKAKMEKKYPSLEAITDEGKKKSLESRWQDIKKSITKKYGENAPAVLTRSYSLAFRFISLVESEKWSGNQQQLEKIFTMIDSWKIELRQIYKLSLVNPKMYFDFVKSIWGKYGLKSPQLSQLESYNESYSNKNLKSMLDTGKDFDENTEKLQKILKGGVDIEGKKYNPVKALENYIKYDIPDAEESRLTPIFQDFLKLINKKEILLSPTELFQELERLKQWLVPSSVILNRLDNKKQQLEKDKKSAQEISRFIDIAKQWRLSITESQLSKIENGKNLSGDYTAWDYSKKDGEKFVRSLEEFEELHKYDLARSLWIWESASIPDIEKALLEKYKDELSLRILHHEIQGTEGKEKNALKNFAVLIEKNGFTRGQARAVLDNIFIEWKAFSEIDIDEIIRSTKDNSTEFSGGKAIKEEVKNAFGTLKDMKQRNIIEFIKDNSIDIDILPQTIKESIKKYEDAPNQEEINRKISAITAMAHDIENSETKEELQDVKNRFDTYINDPMNKIDRNSKEFKDIVDGFIEKYRTLKKTLPWSSDTSRKQEVTKKEIPKESKENIPNYNSIKGYLDEIYPSILLSGDKKAIDKVTKEYDKIVTDEVYLEKIINAANIEDYYKNIFQGVEIFSIRDLWALRNINIKLAEIDTKFVGASKYTQLGDMIRGVTDTDMKNNIIKAIQEMRVSK